MAKQDPIYAALKRHRGKGESYAAWAARLGVPVATLYKWDARRPVLHAATRLMLAGKLGVRL